MLRYFESEELDLELDEAGFESEEPDFDSVDELEAGDAELAPDSELLEDFAVDDSLFEEPLSAGFPLPLFP